MAAAVTEGPATRAARPARAGFIRKYNINPRNYELRERAAEAYSNPLRTSKRNRVLDAATRSPRTRSSQVLLSPFAGRSTYERPSHRVPTAIRRSQHDQAGCRRANGEPHSGRIAHGAPQAPGRARFASASGTASIPNEPNPEARRADR